MNACGPGAVLRIIHLSDIHVWRYVWNPIRLWGKRSVGMASLLAGRAGKFRLERLAAVVERVRGLEPDHLLISGDLTTTALPAEFADASVALAPLLADPAKVTVIPGNHDRYTGNSVRTHQFEKYFGAFAPTPGYPWLRPIGPGTTILGLDPTRSHLAPTGILPADQLARARSLLADAPEPPGRLIVACHYPLLAPGHYAEELRAKRMLNAPAVVDWLSAAGPHLFCCGHVHAAWAFRPSTLPNQLCLNSGAPLLRDPTGLHPPGFLEIELHDATVSVLHHAWVGDAWEVRPFHQEPNFFPSWSAAVTA